MKVKPSLDQRLDARKRPESPIVMRQDWDKLLFLHWEVSAETIQQRLPPQLTVDTFEGKAYLGIVPFSMEKVRPRFCPPVHGISWFLELNLRTYVFDENGVPGVWFFSLDCNQWLAVKLARTLFHLPYQHAKMSITEKNKQYHYQSNLEKDTIQQEYIYPSQFAKETQLAHPNSLEFFLLERYRLFSQKRSGKIYAGMVHHQPYRYSKCDCEVYSTRPFALNGFEEPSLPPASLLIAEKVEVDIYPLKRN
ncbi:DUF2071 domain-containing protein [Akkermansiaceae bacterium]|nr:DUF2071 domain-containing protein [Akkermansiaceae bacterium]